MAALPFFKRRAGLAGLMVLLGLAACSTTKFPENPEAHRLYEELQAAPDEYYFLVRTGVRSRVMGLDEAAARAALDAVAARWDAVDPLMTTDALLAFLRTNDLAILVPPIEETLAQNAASRPAGGADARLEAAAVKQGLIEAFYEFERET